MIASTSPGGWTSSLSARISGFWRHLGSPRILGVLPVRLRVSAILDLAKNPTSFAQVYVAFASLSSFVTFVVARNAPRAGSVVALLATQERSWPAASPPLNPSPPNPSFLLSSLRAFAVNFFCFPPGLVQRGGAALYLRDEFLARSRFRQPADPTAGLPP